MMRLARSAGVSSFLACRLLMAAAIASALPRAASIEAAFFETCSSAAYLSHYGC